MLKMLQIYFLIFMIYAVIGWVVELITMFITEHRFINRGFLIGPWLPIYGYGALCMTILLTPYKNDLFVLFGMAVLVCSILEYITSYLMEKLFKARWWDYSDRKFQLNGRICLSNAILFGIGGVILVRFVNPVILYFLNNNPLFILNTVTAILLIIFLLDNIFSFKIINGFKQTARSLAKDSTEDISSKVREGLGEISSKAVLDIDLVFKKINATRIDIKEKINTIYKNKNYFHQRLIKAFPHFQTRVSKPEKILEEAQKVLEETKQEENK
ncbi:MAG: putative ABC transporter permease [Bacilli bacterium]|nr:putative ABC transporter permease [Bacilli bacterium]